MQLGLRAVIKWAAELQRCCVLKTQALLKMPEARSPACTESRTGHHDGRHFFIQKLAQRRPDLDRCTDQVDALRAPGHRFDPVNLSIQGLVQPGCHATDSLLDAFTDGAELDFLLVVR